MTLTKDYIYSLYDTFKSRAAKAVNCHHYDTALKYLSAASQTAYTFYIGFRDDEIENLLQHISGRIVKRPFHLQSPDRVIMYDTFSQDSQGLTMQYLDAIIAAGWELLYVTEFNLNDPRSRLIRKTLNDYGKATILSVPPCLKGMKRVQFIYDAIINYGAQRLFMQISPSACHSVTAFYALPEDITRYQINLTDHTYWVGSGSMDYIFDWRQYGASLSAQHRGFRKSQIFMLPYYPMMKETPFDGFPKEAEGKIKILAGSSYYKIIDKDDTFFRINKAILDANPEAVTLFAGGGDSAMLDGLIHKYGLQGRFIPIGQRNDIFQCYKHADIYLSTYPLFGGLMGQFAAHAGLPILALQKPGGGCVEECVCQKATAHLTFSTLDELVAEATRLVHDATYRHQQGAKTKQCVITIPDFNQGFASAVSSNSTPYPLNLDDNVIPHYLSIDDKLKLVNSNGDWQRTMFHTLGLHLLSSNPPLWFEGAKRRIKGSRLFKNKKNG